MVCPSSVVRLAKYIVGKYVEITSYNYHDQTEIMLVIEINAAKKFNDGLLKDEYLLDGPIQLLHSRSATSSNTQMTWHCYVT